MENTEYSEHGDQLAIELAEEVSESTFSAFTPRNLRLIFLNQSRQLADLQLTTSILD